MISEFVERRGGGLLMLGGPRSFAEGGYAGTPVADALPVTLERPTRTLDVLPVEPISAEHPLARHPRTLLSPHAAFYSGAAEIELRRKAAMNIIQWATTGRPMYPVIHGTRAYAR